MLGSHPTGRCFKVGRDQRGLPVDKIVRFRIVLARATVARSEVFQDSIPGPDHCTHGDDPQMRAVVREQCF
jgi:hypothetical protein